MQRLEKLKGEMVVPYEFLVVGAGAAGIQAAEVLSAHGKSFLVLQASEVLGGRISTIDIGKMPESKNVSWIQSNQKVRDFQIEKGATWVQAGHEFILELSRQSGIEVREQFGEGNNLYMSKQRIYSNKQFLEDKVMGKKMFEAVKKFEELSKRYGEVVLEGRKRNKEADDMLRKYDSMTVSEFLGREFPDAFVREFLQNIIEHTQCADCSENSMHEVLTKNYCSDDIQIVKEFLGGDFEHSGSYLINGGSELFIEKMLKRVETHSKKTRKELFLTNCPVKSIDNSGPVIVVTAQHNGKQNTFRCKKVVVTVPIAVVKNVSIAKLSPAKQLIFSNQLETSAQKSFVICKRPFWRELGWSGDLLFSPEYNINMVHDISPTDGSCGILVMFHNATKLVAWEKQFAGSKNQADSKRKFLVELMAQMFLNGNVKHPDLQDVVFAERTFNNDQYIRSGFQSNNKPGTFSKLLSMNEGLEAFYRDENGLVFAGSEYSDEFASYMEGAIRSARKKLYQSIGIEDPLLAQLSSKKPK